MGSPFGIWVWGLSCGVSIMGFGSGVSVVGSLLWDLGLGAELWGLHYGIWVWGLSCGVSIMGFGSGVSVVGSPLIVSGSTRCISSRSGAAGHLFLLVAGWRSQLLSTVACYG